MIFWENLCVQGSRYNLNTWKYTKISLMWCFLVFHVISRLLNIQNSSKSRRLLILWPSNYAASLKKIWHWEPCEIPVGTIPISQYILVFHVISQLLHIEISLKLHRILILWPSNYSANLKKIWQQEHREICLGTIKKANFRIFPCVPSDSSAPTHRNFFKIAQNTRLVVL